jgi:HlyD family secretion protein
MRRAVIPIILALVVSFGSCGERLDVPQGSGFVEATEVILSAEATGRIESIRVIEGRPVAEGDTVAVIDTMSVALRLRKAAAGLQAADTKVSIAGIQSTLTSKERDLAEKEFQRMKGLIGSGSVNQQQYDQTELRFRQASLAVDQATASGRMARAELEGARAEIAFLEEQLSDCIITTPLSGVIMDTFVEEGEFTVVGKPIVRIASLDTVWVKVYLPPKDLTRVTLGGPAEVDPEDETHSPLAGRVSWISEEAEFTPKNVQTKEARANLVYAVKITVSNPDGILKIGMPVYVRIR